MAVLTSIDFKNKDRGMRILTDFSTNNGTMKSLSYYKVVIASTKIILLQVSNAMHSKNYVDLVIEYLILVILALGIRCCNNRALCL